MTNPPFRLPRGCLWSLLILGGLSLLVGILSLLAIPKLYQRSREEWTQTAGTIVEPYVKTGERLHSTSHKKRGRTQRHETRKPTFNVHLKYRYIVAGQEYAGDAPALRQPDNDEEAQQAQAIIPTYPAGDTLEVFHHPTNVERSRLTVREPVKEFALDVFFAIAFLLFGIVLIFFGRWGSRSAVNRS